MTVQTTTKKALETAHQAADDILDGASDTVQSARDMANHSLDKATAAYTTCARTWTRG